MPLELRIPTRINILGNPSDGLEGDFAAISSAVNVFAGVFIDGSDNLVIEQLSNHNADSNILHKESYPLDVIPLPYTGSLDLVKGAVNRLYAYSDEFRQKYAKQGLRIATWTEVPRQSGLGRSSLLVILALAGLRTFYELDPQFHNDYVLAELTQRVESKELGITCDFADRYVPLFGGLAYLDYRGKLFQKELGEEPFFTYERLDLKAPDPSLVAVSTGIRRDSGDVHARMRPRYLEEHSTWATPECEIPPMVSFMHGAWNTAWRGKIALLKADWITFGALMTQNYEWVDQMMKYCGFEQGAGWANNLLIETALKSGALGAKLTGAGGGDQSLL